MVSSASIDDLPKIIRKDLLEWQAVHLKMQQKVLN